MKAQKGITLIELMVVVAIVGVIAASAVYMFSKQTTRAKAGEVNAVFTEMSLRQESFLTENGNYVVGDETAGSWFPDNTPAHEQRDGSLGGGWESTLRLNTGKQNLYCSYTTISQTGDLSGVGTGIFGINGAIPVPASGPWYVNLAQCDFDGDGTRASYAQLSWRDRILVNNPGE